MIFFSDVVTTSVTFTCRTRTSTQLVGIDLDEGENAALTFSLVAGLGTEYFEMAADNSVKPKSGVQFDRELSPSNWHGPNGEEPAMSWAGMIPIVVRVRDNGISSLSSIPGFFLLLLSLCPFASFSPYWQYFHTSFNYLTESPARLGLARPGQATTSTPRLLK